MACWVELADHCLRLLRSQNPRLLPRNDQPANQISQNPRPKQNHRAQPKDAHQRQIHIQIPRKRGTHTSEPLVIHRPHKPPLRGPSGRKATRGLTRLLKTLRTKPIAALRAEVRSLVMTFTAIRTEHTSIYEPPLRKFHLRPQIRHPRRIARIGHRKANRILHPLMPNAIRIVRRRSHRVTLRTKLAVEAKRHRPPLSSRHRPHAQILQLRIRPINLKANPRPNHNPDDRILDRRRELHLHANRRALPGLQHRRRLIDRVQTRHRQNLGPPVPTLQRRMQSGRRQSQSALLDHAPCITVNDLARIALPNQPPTF